MDQIRELKQLMDALNRQFGMISQSNASRIEIDIMMRTLQELYDHLYVLKNNPAGITTATEAEEKTIQPTIEPEIKLEETEIFGIRHIEPVTVNEEPKTQDPVIAELNETKAEVNHQPQPVEVRQQPRLYNSEAPVKAPASRSRQSAAETYDPVTTVAQSFTGKTTLHDRMSSTRSDRSVADHLQSKPLTDLKKSIGVNEKYVLVNDLFKGNHQLYNQSIDELNSFTNFDQAQSHLNEKLAVEMQWDTSGKSFNALNELLKRRFTAK